MQSLPIASLAILALCAPIASAQQAPGDWQQGLEYRVEARLDEATEMLEGSARVFYRNNAPEPIDDFYFHLHLNAFRPNSAWARRDLAAGITTFQDLGPDEHGFERVLEMTAGGTPVRLRYPFAPDSTVVGFDLPEPLEPGQTLTVEYRWEARPAIVPRRQGRRGRHYDFAQWYPRVVVYDDEGWRIHPLYRAGEFYGEFATYDVTMEVREDQVVAATGVPIEGDPGWAGASVPGGARHYIEGWRTLDALGAQEWDRLRAQSDEEAEAARRTVAADLPLPARVTVLHGEDAAEAIAAYARRTGADLIALTTHARGPFGELVWGSTAKALTRSGVAPVLLVHPAE